MAEKGKVSAEHLGAVLKLRQEHEKVVKDCESRIQHWMKVSDDYAALNQRLATLPDQLCYDVMVPFGGLAFMPGKLVHTNEVTVLLGDNWFAKVSTKQARRLVDHRMTHVKNELEDLSKTLNNFKARVGFVKDLESMSESRGGYVDIREDAGDQDATGTRGKPRIAHKLRSKPKLDFVVDLKEEEEVEVEGEEEGSQKSVLTKEELWARLDELEKLEELQDEQDRLSDHADLNGEDTTTSSSEEEREVNGLSLNWTSATHGDARREQEEEEEEEEEEHALPTIFFSHTVEPKKVRINTGKNTTLKFSERKEQKEHSKRKKKNGHSHHELHRITTPADVYRSFVDVKNGEPVPRKSILKSRSRENSVCSDTSESSAADFDERRLTGRGLGHDDANHSDANHSDANHSDANHSDANHSDANHSDASDGVADEEGPVAPPPPSRFQAFSGTVIEKDPMPSSVPHLTIAPPTLPTILERKQEEVAPDGVAPPPPPAPKRVSKFKAARLQQK